MNRSGPFIPLGAALLFTVALTGQTYAAEGFSMTTGSHDRGSSSDLFVNADSRVLPIRASFETERLLYSGTVSYLQVSGLRGVPGDDYRWVKSARDDYGTPLADFVAKDAETSVTYKVPQMLPGGWLLDVTGALKLINGDLLGRSTILKNYSLQLAFTREFGLFTAEAGGAYRLRDHRQEFGYQNSASAYVGGGYQFNRDTKLEIYFDVSQGAQLGAPNEAEVTAYFSHHLPAKNLSLQTYAFKGMSRENRDLETGLVLKLRF